MNSLEVLNGMSIKKHYHWIIALLMLLELAVFSGILNNLISLHMIPVTEELQISRGSFSLAFTLRPLVGFFSTLLSGVFFARYGFRKLASLGLLVAALSFVLLGCSENLFMLALASAVMGLSEGFCTTAAASRMVNTWFHTNQGLVLGLVTASTGLGGSLFSIILSKVIDAGSWRSSYWLSAVLIAAVAVLMVLFCRNHPSDIGLRPFGADRHHGKKAKKESRDHWGGFEAPQVMGRPAFYLMLLVVFLSCVCCYAAFSVVAPHLQDMGFTAAQAAFYQSIMLLALAASKFICGLLSDLWGAKAINLLCMVCTIAGLVLLAFASTPAIALAAVIVFSVALVLTTITVPLLSNALFGYHCQGSVIGIFMALVPAASVVTSPIVNILYDRIGSYSPIFLVTAVLAAAVTGLMLLLFALAGKDRKAYEATHQTTPESEEVL